MRDGICPVAYALQFDPQNIPEQPGRTGSRRACILYIRREKWGKIFKKQKNRVF